MDALRLGGELVDGGRVDGVLALLCALDVAILAAALAEEVAFQSLAVRTAPAAAFCGKCSPSSATTGGPAIQTRLARLRRLPVLLDRGWPATSTLGAGRPILGEAVGLEDDGWEGAAQLG